MEELEVVGGRDGHQGMVRSTVKVAMVIMASVALLQGMPIAIVLENLFFCNGRMSTNLTRIVVIKKSGRHVTSHCISHLAHCCDIYQPLSVSPEVALHNYKVAQKAYQDLQPKASQLCWEFLHQKLLSLGLLDENQQAIHHVLTVEQSRDTFHAI